MLKAMFPGLAILLAIVVSAGADDGKLEQFQEEIRGGAQKETKRNKPADCDCQPTLVLPPELFDYTGFWIEGCCFITNLPFALPKALLHDDEYDFKNPIGIPYRYVEAAEDGAGERPWALRAGLAGSYNFDDVGRLDLTFALTTASRVGVETTWTYFQEDFAGPVTDEAVMGQLDLTYRFAQGPQGEFRVGAGCRTFGHTGDFDAGLNLVYAADFFPSPPWVLSTRLSGGTLGRAGVFDGGFSVGAMLGRVELFAGYQLLLIGDETLHGPLAGLRLFR